MRRIGVPVLFSVLLASGCQSASVAPATRTASASIPIPFHGPYLRAADFDYRALLGDPPAEGSPAQQREIQRLLELQAGRTPEQVRRLKSEEQLEVFTFAPAIGPWFSAKNLPLTDELMRKVNEEAQSIDAAAKRIWKRRRPPQADPRIKPCLPQEPSASYPSGDATRGAAWAALLAELFPERRDAILARGRQLGSDRVLGGIHYPSDVRAGQTLGAEIARRLLDNPRFVADFERVQAECRRFYTPPSQGDSVYR